MKVAKINETKLLVRKQGFQELKKIYVWSQHLTMLNLARKRFMHLMRKKGGGLKVTKKIEVLQLSRNSQVLKDQKQREKR